MDEEEEDDDGKSVISLESGDSHSEGSLEKVEEEEEVEDDVNSVAENDSNNEDEDPAEQEYYENFFRRVNISNNSHLFDKCKNCSVFHLKSFASKLLKQWNADTRNIPEKN